MLKLDWDVLAAKAIAPQDNIQARAALKQAFRMLFVSLVKSSVRGDGFHAVPHFLWSSTGVRMGAPPGTIMTAMAVAGSLALVFSSSVWTAPTGSKLLSPA